MPSLGIDFDSGGCRGWVAIVSGRGFGVATHASAEGAFYTSLGQSPRYGVGRICGLKARSIISAMPQTLGFVLIHLIFSTKDRMPLLREAVRLDLHAYLASVVRSAGCECYRVGGVADHVHLAIRLSRSMTVADLVAEVKVSSSNGSRAGDHGLGHFAWQKGYGVFSVSPADLGALSEYIDGQESHHAKRSFQEEFLGFLKRYGVDFDERYVWD